MRVARVMGTVTLNGQLPDWPRGALLICEALDARGLSALPEVMSRRSPMPESLVVLDELGAGKGQLIAVSEGREAAMPFHPDRRPVDAYNVAILDRLSVDETLLSET